MDYLYAVQLNVLVANAGISRTEDLTADDWDASAAQTIVETNILGVIRTTAALLPMLKGRPDAVIMATTSNLAFIPRADFPTYCASKAFLHSWLQSLRHQLRKIPVEVLELSPPYVQTELTGEHQASDPRAMPLAAYVAEVMHLLEAQDYPRREDCEMTSTLFLGFVALTAALAVGLLARYRSRRAAVFMVAGLLPWLIYVGLLAYFGVIRNTTLRPPGPVFLFVPVVVFLTVCVVRIRSMAGADFARAFPLWILLGTQSFRVVVELFIHQLWLGGLVPRMLTFAGANVDIYVGASAPLIAWFSTRGQAGRRLALVWNGLGLLALANVVTRAVGTAPGPLHFLHTEVPNLMIGTFPFTYIPGFFVPLAVVLHLLAIRVIVSRPQAESA